MAGVLSVPTLVRHRRPGYTDGNFENRGDFRVRYVHLITYAVLALCAGANAAAPDLKACFPLSLPIHFESFLPFVSVSVGSEEKSSEAWFILDTGSNGSYVDPAAVDKSVLSEPRPDTGEISTELYSFFDPVQTVSLRTQNYAGLDLGIRQAGLLGTDFFTDRLYWFDYEKSEIRQGVAGLPCSAELLSSNGFRPLSTHGYFSDDAGKLLGFDQVNPALGAIHPLWKVPNVPTITIGIGSVVAPAQLDTGFDDGKNPLSVNINAAFMRGLLESGMVLAADPSSDFYLSTCVPGVSEKVLAYVLPPEQSLRFLGEDGSSVREFSGIHLFLKNVDPRTEVCGGIGNWTVPAAQLGASFLRKTGGAVLDAAGERVWMKPYDSAPE